MSRFAEGVREILTREITKLDIGSIPSAVAANVSVEEQVPIVHRTVIDLNDVPITISDANVGGGVAIYTFPEGHIRVLGAIVRNLKIKTTSALASTLNAGVALSVGVGTVKTTTQGSGTLATTQQNIVNQFAATSSAVVNEDPAAVNAGGITTPLAIDGTGTKGNVNLNIGVPTATDIDGDATVTVDGQIEIDWMLMGDY